MAQRYPLPGSTEFNEFCRQHNLTAAERNKLRVKLLKIRPQRIHGVRPTTDFSRIIKTGTEYESRPTGWSPQKRL